MAASGSVSASNALRRLENGTKLNRSEVDVLKDEYEKLTKEIARLQKEVQNNKHQQSQLSGSTRQSEDRNGQPSVGVEDKRSHKLRDEIDGLKRENHELRNRLSQVIGDKIVRGNASITDLSDPYRPVALGEKFKQVYDTEWAEAYEALEKQRLPEVTILDVLCDIIRQAEVYCKDALNQTIERIHHYAMDDVINIKLKTGSRNELQLQTSQKRPVTESDEELSKRLLKNYVKDMCHLSAPTIVALFTATYTGSKINIRTPGTPLNKYASKIIDYVWRMQLADPPMALLWPKQGEKFDRDVSSFYIAQGTNIERSVWPTVLLHESGNVVTKGVVICK